VDVIEAGELLKGRFPVRAVQFFFGQLNQFIETPGVALLEQWVLEHRAERRRQRQAQPGIDAFLLPALQ
jgi:hypothetical protein